MIIYIHHNVMFLCSLVALFFSFLLLHTIDFKLFRSPPNRTM